jgi:hypothetical protein
VKLICPNCGGSASVPMEMAGYCRDHRPRLVPERIQLRRTKGWRKPEGAVVVARPSRWGNPFPVDFFGCDEAVRMYRDWVTSGVAWWMSPGDDGVHRFTGIGVRRPSADDIRSALRGRDLACWCPLDQPCHADVLLELANTEATR